MKRIYMFGEGGAELKNLLGGKGANLSQMKKMGVPVPSGFTITTDMCNAYYDNGGKNSPELLEDIKTYVKRLEEETGKSFGDASNPLLVSVRSGARVSMPGQEVVKGMIEKTNNPRFVWDSYRRLIQMFGEVVREVEYEAFDGILEGHKEAKGYTLDVQMTAEDWKAVSLGFLEVYEKHVGEPFPEDPLDQLYQLESTVSIIKSITNLEPPSTFKPWFLETLATTQERVFYLRVTLKLESVKSLENSYLTPKVKTSSQGLEPRFL